MSGTELENAVAEAKNSLWQIVTEAEKFANENILNDGLFGFGRGWNDACGKKISRMLVAAVEDAVGKNFNINDCEARLEKISDDISPLISIIEAAKEELK